MIFCVEVLLDIGFHTLSLMNSTYPSTIWDKSRPSYARAFANNSVYVLEQSALNLPKQCKDKTSRFLMCVWVFIINELTKT